MKYRRPFTKAEQAAFDAAFEALVEPAPQPAWESAKAGLEGLRKKAQQCGDEVARSIAFWRLYDADRRHPGAPAGGLRHSVHFNNMAYWAFEQSVQEAITRLFAYREAVALAARLGQVARGATKLPRRAPFEAVLESARVVETEAPLWRILDGYFHRPLAGVLAAFQGRLSEGVVPCIDFRRADAEPGGAMPAEPDFRSDDLVAALGEAWQEAVWGTDRLVEDGLI